MADLSVTYCFREADECLEEGEDELLRLWEVPDYEDRRGDLYPCEDSSTAKKSCGSSGCEESRVDELSFPEIEVKG